MDAVKNAIESLGGRVQVATERGRGTTTSFLVPLAAAVQRVLLVEAAGETVCVPIAKIERILEVEASAIESAGRERFVFLDDEPLLVLDLGDCLGWGACARPNPRSVPLVLAELRGQRVAIEVDRLAGQQEVYVKPAPDLFGALRALAGLTVLGDGRPVFLLDLGQLG
jgi:two-component system chemotaxis sensor kinase CheA